MKVSTGFGSLLIAMTGVASASSLALADDTTAGYWDFQGTAYVWAPAVNGDNTIKGIETEVDASFIDIVRNSDSIFAYNGQLRATKGDVTFELNPTYMRLGADDDNIDGPLNTRIDAVTEITYLEFAALYRIGTWPVGYNTTEQTLSIEPLAGVRYTRLYLDLDVDFPLLGTKTSRDGHQDWIDPFVGARAVLQITKKTEFQLRGDIGGFGVGSEFSWQVVGGLSHRFSMFGYESLAIAGYRALYQNYEDGDGADKFRWKTTLFGPILGLTVRF